MTTTAEFTALTAQFRPELLAHCYRILGSIHDAEDQVQETYLRAWRGFGRFEGRSSVRRWMYTIATRTCLSAIENRGRRPLPSGIGPPAEDHRIPLSDRTPEVPWLQPIPDSLVGQQDPAVIVDRRDGLRLALIAALQYLPARQRAALTLRDILAFPATETAEILDTTVDAVDALLRRARRTLDMAGVAVDEVSEPEDDHTRELLQRYLDAFTRADPHALVDLVRADVEFEMPPTPTWFSGSAAVIGFLGNRVLRRPGQWHAVPTRANGQPALVFYARHDDGTLHGYGVQVLTLRGGRISRITAFNEPALVPSFGPPVLTQPREQS
ncbi:sigma-70 family RNA polymerase sigma factor [Mycolicibacterium sp. CBMA 226]|uniref:sigma-70 family RNA polymerase sigma factor n=1 Tax=Mycolicibacterium sp. CBMA 226 TaxID=2606611 RepID=UPI0012DC4AD3|nr:sigma-70 family RNA polymerase sigma factor [Mycolicibacterium sp. CBMA 226]MUL76221.1 sigma-70 family RNA polymerase sigma factor [Mycolicibacterium sp. CBMA 226]